VYTILVVVVLLLVFGCKSVLDAGAPADPFFNLRVLDKALCCTVMVFTVVLVTAPLDLVVLVDVNGDDVAADEGGAMDNATVGILTPCDADDESVPLLLLLEEGRLLGDLGEDPDADDCRFIEIGIEMNAAMLMPWLFRPGCPRVLSVISLFCGFVNAISLCSS